MNSQNHVMLLGDLVIWMYEDLAGIKTDPLFPGFKKLDMAPSLTNGLTSVNATYESIHGTIASRWTRQGNTFTWHVTVPANTRAVLHIPGSKATEGGKKLTALKDITVRDTSTRTTVEIGSGDYVFKSQIGK